MSAIEYKNLLFEISARLVELNEIDRLEFMCRGTLSSGREDNNIRNVLSLFRELEEQNYLGIDRLEEMKELLKGVGEWALNEKVERFESKRKEYSLLLEQIICALDELNDLERLVTMCRGNISEESEGSIQDVRSLFKELENQNNLGTHRLDILKGILTEIEKSDLVKEVEAFEERRKQEDESKKKDDNFQRRKAQAAAVVSTVGNKLIGVLNVKTVFKVVAGGITVWTTLDVLSRWSTFDQLVTAVNSCVLPAGTNLVQLTDGCVCLTVQAESLSALTTLWKLYQDGTLEARLYDFFVTDDVRERAGGEEVEVNVTIDDQEYEKACLELINEAQEAASSGTGVRTRRNSDSAMYFKPKEEPALIKVKHAETELKFHIKRIEVIRRELEQLCPEILEATTPEEKATVLRQHETRKDAREAEEMDDRRDEPETSRLNKAELMDPGKYAFVQQYLQDVQETRSVTTETSDSGLATHATASELGNEEINEASKLRLKDLNKEVTQELIKRLEGDKAAKGNFFRFFGLKVTDRYGVTEIAKELFPDTTVSVLKECFEALQLYDLAELLEKVKPRSLHPALSQKQVEELGRDDRPTKYHTNVAVLVVNRKASAKDDFAEKIKTFFKELDLQNEVAVVTLPGSRETKEILREIKQMRLEQNNLQAKEKRWRYQLVNCAAQRREHLEEKKPRIKEGLVRFHPEIVNFPKERPEQIEKDEEKARKQLDDCIEKGAKVRAQIESNIQRMNELVQETEKAISTAMDKWIQNQEKFTCVAVFVVSNWLWRALDHHTESMLERCIVKSLELIPDHAKLVVGPSWWNSIGKVPETLHVMHPDSERRTPLIFTWMVEIFNRRWQTLDLHSMMQELKRTCSFHEDREDVVSTDSLSTRLKFRKKEGDSE